MESPVNRAPAGISDAERMSDLIDTLAGFIEFYHGGSIKMVSFDGETLKVKLMGRCEGCALSPLTLHGWVEGTVKPFFPALKKVEAVP
ncbi:MAG: NifU family protein [Chloroflexi bacterium]|nr:NifU family protein [Chloroflexota bacterium]MBI3733920.1 NifU family protein [Chloroflexota bacterium]